MSKQHCLDHLGAALDCAEKVRDDLRAVAPLARKQLAGRVLARADVDRLAQRLLDALLTLGGGRR